MNRQEALSSPRRMWSVRLPESLLESLRQEAKQTERSGSDLLIRILSDRYHPQVVDRTPLPAEYVQVLEEADLSSLFGKEG